MCRTLILVVVALAGCAPQNADVHGLAGGGGFGPAGGTGPHGVAPTPPEGSDPSTADADELGYQQGSMGDVDSFDSPATRVEITPGAGQSTLRIDSLAPTYWVMTYLTIGASLDALEEDVDYHTGEGAAPGAQPLWLTARGCSGPEMEHYTYDDVACDVSVRRERGPDGSPRLAYTVMFETGQIVRGWAAL